MLSTSAITYNAAHLPKLTTDALLIGGYSFGSNSQFDGYLDELRISNVARDALPTNVAKVSVSHSFTVSPNPSSGLVRIAKTGSENTILCVQVLNLNGQVLYKSMVNGGASERSIDLSDLPKGVYLLKMSDQLKTQTEKLVLN
ncbi:MAG: T9SS type A sorting domain-containing protein [Bacteroidia bacterium]|nr:T9SS type A sorting domain-containing protein [Bacteroidia bacterium]